MIKYTLPFFLFLFCNLSSSQNIQIGQDAQLVKQLVEWSTKNNNKADVYGNRANSHWTYDTKYGNGVLLEVYQCYENQYLIDFKLNANYCKRFIMENNKLSYVLSQFENLSIEQLREIYNSTYSESKIGEFYFFDNYKSYSKIYLSNDGLATIELRNTIMSELPKAVQQKLVEVKGRTSSTQKADSISNYRPADRKVIRKPQPNYVCNEQGVVVVQVSVDRLGNVLKAVPGIDGTTNNSKCLFEQAKIAALNIKMDSNQDAPEIEVRKITYNFKF